MAKTGLIRIHWSKDGKDGGGFATLALDQECCEVEIEIDPVQGAPLWIDLAPAPALVQISGIEILGQEGQVLRRITDADEIGRLATGPSAWWTTDAHAQLLALGDEDLFSIDIPEAGVPARKVRLHLAFVKTGNGSSLAQAMGELLVEARREHEMFAEQIGSLIAWQQARSEPSGTAKRPDDRKRRWGAG